MTSKINSPHTRHGGVFLLLAIVVVTSLAGGFGGSWIENHYVSDTALTSQKKIFTSQGQVVSQIARGVGPSVVSVNVSIPAASDTSAGGFGFFGFTQPDAVQAAGTGIIISSNGIVMTNRHVVPAGTAKVSITLSDGTELKNVSVLGRTAETDSLDVAFLKIEDTKGHKLKAAALGNSALVQVGDNVVAIGNALGQFQNTVTSGIISGYGRSVQAGDSSGSSTSAENLDNLFQTDAAINEGNSGGPLVNLNGEVIGINTAIAGNAQNIGFAIPINDVHGLVAQVLKTGKFARPYLGVHYIPLTPDIASQFNLKVSDGAFIAPASNPASPSVVSDGPAAQAGLQETDIITAVDGHKINQKTSLISLLTQHQPGDKVKLSVLRSGKSITLTVTLGELPAI